MEGEPTLSADGSCHCVLLPVLGAHEECEVSGSLVLETLRIGISWRQGRLPHTLLGREGVFIMVANRRFGLIDLGVSPISSHDLEPILNASKSHFPPL